jgi:hypothetical protein
MSPALLGMASLLRVHQEVQAGDRGSRKRHEPDGPGEAWRAGRLGFHSRVPGRLGLHRKGGASALCQGHLRQGVTSSCVISATALSLSWSHESKSTSRLCSSGISNSNTDRSSDMMADACRTQAVAVEASEFGSVQCRRRMALIAFSGALPSVCSFFLAVIRRTLSRIQPKLGNSSHVSQSSVPQARQWQ